MSRHNYITGLSSSSSSWTVGAILKYFWPWQEAYIIELLSITFMQVHDPMHSFLHLQDTIRRRDWGLSDGFESLLAGGPSISIGFPLRSSNFGSGGMSLASGILQPMWLGEAGKVDLARSCRFNEGSEPQGVRSVI